MSIPPQQERGRMPESSDAPLILCYDGSEGAKRGIQRAGDLLAPRPALVLTVWEPVLAVGPGLGGTASTVNFAELDRAVAEDGGRIAEEGARIARGAGLEAEPMSDIRASLPSRSVTRQSASASASASDRVAEWRAACLSEVSRTPPSDRGAPSLLIRPPRAPSLRSARSDSRRRPGRGARNRPAWPAAGARRVAHE